ncbi:hypothetical protein [Dokdonia sp. Hel_I_53]|uniref:hypothetical protein n=1 Tax=Dokdonia sp. Hel_I_53 TaxID=1566287 RepID=UPI00119BE57E|nr:hypothetical protein [Dokdonia sp. Hel_I_53]TVZ51477.1 hypothetical protein OD90_0620 [Dokdonia sp. Hel_I_53]
MKTIQLLTAVIISTLLFSCKESKPVYANENGETWELITMQRGSLAGAESQPLPYQEHYEFLVDMTFKKNRDEKDTSLSGSGTYKTNTTEEGIYYNLSYKNTAPSLIGSCTGNKTETLLLKPDGKLQNSWAMCDGPFKVYVKQ